MLKAGGRGISRSSNAYNRGRWLCIAKINEDYCTCAISVKNLRCCKLVELSRGLVRSHALVKRGRHDRGIVRIAHLLQTDSNSRSTSTSVLLATKHKMSLRLWSSLQKDVLEQHRLYITHISTARAYAARCEGSLPCLDSYLEEATIT